MSKYNTKQRKILLAYLNQHPDKLMSTHQIAEALQNQGISLSAVYRNLSQLEVEEKVRRCTKAGTREVFYQYIAAEACKGALHMICIKCGRTFHMAHGNLTLFTKYLEESENFTLDTTDTVLYGICLECKES
ncbi:Fur family transcriptional regulator [Acetivibrio ethanolgignens]|uniref:Fur family transcriptional regulator n=1 Tax=Acetivibrio ethanolgignens TaxID=290052 RepID=A0A0V8QG34_9FIRM|nr:transcriptional repressor [Acetivibrio ethanolgignens]KSV59206.1 hypothetical protein ASU35_10215 [Acetivibrio ethanolgignens]